MKENLIIKSHNYKELKNVSGKIGIFKLRNMGCMSIFIKKGNKEIELKKAGSEVTIKNIIPAKVYVKSKGSLLII